MPYSVEWLRQGIIWTFFGIVTSEEALRSNQELYGDPRFDNTRFQLADFSTVEKVEFTVSDVKRIAYLDRAAALTNGNLRVAIIADQSILEDYMLTYAKFAPRNAWKVKLFQTREEACGWLEAEGCSLEA